MKIFLYITFILGFYLLIGGLLEYYNPTSFFIFGLQNFDNGRTAIPIAGAALMILSGIKLYSKYYQKV